MDGQERNHPTLTSRTKLFILAICAVIVVTFLVTVQSILAPFLWALIVAYLLMPIVNYFNVRGGLPRIWCVALIYVSVGLALFASARYLYPRVVEQGNLLLEDLPKLQASIEGHFGTRPLGIDIDSLVRQLLQATGFLTGTSTNAGHILQDAFTVVIKLFLFLVSTFYLLVDGPRLKQAARESIPAPYREEITALGQQINVTWQQYIRGELVLFTIMATVTTLGLTILGVPGSLFVGLASGALELLPLIGPLSAGALACSVAYFAATNPWGWDQTAYAGVVALMYFVLRQAEDYFVIPNVLGRAVRLHPLVVLFAVTTGGVAAGLLGLVLAVPVAASVKEIWIYLRAKLLDLPVEFQPIKTLGGGVIHIPVKGRHSHSTEVSPTEGAGKP